MMKTELKVGLALLCVWGVVNVLRRDPAARQIPALVEQGALVVDVRTAGEFAGGHIEGAVNIPYDVVADEIQTQEADPAQPVILYCQSGSRSGAAKRSLIQAGYTNVINGGSYRAMRSRLSK